MKIKVRSLDVDEAIRLLDDLGSSEDPIIFHGKKITPNDFLYETYLVGNEMISDTMKASRVRIKFWGIRDGKSGWCSGSLYSMVLDRLQK